MASLILGVMGKKRSGKDTFASRLVSTHGFTRLAFADALKDTMLDLDPYVCVEMDEAGIVFGRGAISTRPSYVRLSSVISDCGWETAKEIREVRRLLQAHGVAMRDHASASIWVDAVADKAAQIAGPVVITDVRFPNEADFIEDVGGRLIRVVRPGQLSDDTHISETALDDRSAQHIVTNATTIEDLHAAADFLVRLHEAWL